MPTIFLSYRRDDSNARVGRIYDRLEARFGRDFVFRDMDRIPAGRDFRKVLDAEVSRCDVLLAIIGEKWLKAMDELGRRRLENPADFVRIEIESALNRDIPVIPVVVGNASMPRVEDLPKSLHDLCFRHGVSVRDDPDFRTDIHRLICVLESFDAQKVPASEIEEPAPVVDESHVGASTRTAEELLDGSRDRSVPSPLAVESTAEANVGPVQLQGNPDETEARKSDGVVHFELWKPPILISPFGGEKARRAQEEWARHLASTSFPEAMVEIRNSRGMQFTLIPRGEFLCGSAGPWSSGFDDIDDVRRDSEYPQHRVRIDRPFYLGTHVVTRDDWRAVMHHEPWKGRGERSDDSRLPATRVSWDDAQKFCRRLGQADRCTYRLPTEAEWEYACRAGTIGRYFSESNPSKLSEFAWYSDSNAARRNNSLQRVGLKKPNSFGLYDTLGNVFEWCEDYFSVGEYAERSIVQQLSDEGVVINPIGFLGGQRVYRGGSWANSAERARAAARGGLAHDARHALLGFRVVRVL